MLLSACRFCDDNHNPLHPGTILLLTIDHTEKDDTSSKSWLENKLRAHWSSNDHEIAPILSRIGNNWVTFATRKQKYDWPSALQVGFCVVSTVLVKKIISTIANE